MYNHFSLFSLLSLATEIPPTHNPKAKFPISIFFPASTSSIQPPLPRLRPSLVRWANRERVWDTCLRERRSLSSFTLRLVACVLMAYEKAKLSLFIMVIEEEYRIRHQGLSEVLHVFFFFIIRQAFWSEWVSGGWDGRIEILKHFVSRCSFPGCCFRYCLFYIDIKHLPFSSAFYHESCMVRFQCPIFSHDPVNDWRALPTNVFRGAMQFLHVSHWVGRLL